MNGQQIAARLYGGRASTDANTTPLFEAIRERTRQAMSTVSKAFLDELDKMDAPEPASADRWDLEANPVIAGRIMEIEEVETSNGSGTKVTLNDEGPDRLGPVNFFANTVIKNQFERQKVAVGTVVGIKYFGEVESKSGRTYKNFSVKVQEENPAQKPLPNTEDVDPDPFEDE